MTDQRLAPAHQRLLEASAIAPAVAAARGYRTVVDDVELARLGFSRGQRLGSGLLIPVYGVDGQLKTHQYRPDRPRLDAKGRPRQVSKIRGAARSSWMCRGRPTARSPIRRFPSG